MASTLRHTRVEFDDLADASASWSGSSGLSPLPTRPTVAEVESWELHSNLSQGQLRPRFLRPPREPSGGRRDEGPTPALRSLSTSDPLRRLDLDGFGDRSSLSSAPRRRILNSSSGLMSSGEIPPSTPSVDSSCPLLPLDVVASKDDGAGLLSSGEIAPPRTSCRSGAGGSVHRSMPSSSAWVALSPDSDGPSSMFTSPAAQRKRHGCSRYRTASSPLPRSVSSMVETPFSLQRSRRVGRAGSVRAAMSAAGPSNIRDKEGPRSCERSGTETSLPHVQVRVRERPDRRMCSEHWRSNSPDIAPRTVPTPGGRVTLAGAGKDDVELDVWASCSSNQNLSSSSGAFQGDKHCRRGGSPPLVKEGLRLEAAKVLETSPVVLGSPVYACESVSSSSLVPYLTPMPRFPADKSRGGLVGTASTPKTLFVGSDTTQVTKPSSDSDPVEEPPQQTSGSDSLVLVPDLTPPRPEQQMSATCSVAEVETVLASANTASLVSSSGCSSVPPFAARQRNASHVVASARQSPPQSDTARQMPPSLCSPDATGKHYSQSFLGSGSGPSNCGARPTDVAEWTSTSASERRFACVVSPEPPSASCSDIEEALGSMRTPSSTSSEDEEVISAGHGQSVSREEVDGVQVAAVLSGQDASSRKFASARDRFKMSVGAPSRGCQFSESDRKSVV